MSQDRNIVLHNPARMESYGAARPNSIRKGLDRFPFPTTVGELVAICEHMHDLGYAIGASDGIEETKLRFASGEMTVGK